MALEWSECRFCGRKILVSDKGNSNYVCSNKNCLRVRGLRK
jgi:hypothetical protein